MLFTSTRRERPPGRSISANSSTVRQLWWKLPLAEASQALIDRQCGRCARCGRDEGRASVNGCGLLHPRSPARGQHPTYTSGLATANRKQGLSLGSLQPEIRQWHFGRPDCSCCGTQSEQSSEDQSRSRHEELANAHCIDLSRNCHRRARQCSSRASSPPPIPKRCRACRIDRRHSAGMILLRQCSCDTGFSRYRHTCKSHRSLRRGR